MPKDSIYDNQDHNLILLGQHPTQKFYSVCIKCRWGDSLNMLSSFWEYAELWKFNRLWPLSRSKISFKHAKRYPLSVRQVRLDCCIWYTIAYRFDQIHNKQRSDQIHNRLFFDQVLDSWKYQANSRSRSKSASCLRSRTSAMIARILHWPVSDKICPSFRQTVG